jgi:hypothetical protein
MLELFLALSLALGAATATSSLNTAIDPPVHDGGGGAAAIDPPVHDGGT